MRTMQTTVQHIEEAGEQSINNELAAFNLDLNVKLELEPLTPAERSIIRLYILNVLDGKVTAPTTASDVEIENALGQMNVFLLGLRQPTLQKSECAMLKTYILWTLGKWRVAETDS